MLYLILVMNHTAVGVVLVLWLLSVRVFWLLSECSGCCQSVLAVVGSAFYLLMDQLSQRSGSCQHSVSALAVGVDMSAMQLLRHPTASHTCRPRIILTHFAWPVCDTYAP
jgi:hypothetical protein